jgi:GDP-L-fucose synthase
MAVESLLAGPPEPTSDAYATAKLAGWKLCQAHRRQYGVRFLTAFPANPFGPGDDFSPEAGHVIPGLMRRMHEARLRGLDRVTVWGTGTPRREFLYARDLADACVFALDHYDGDAPINLAGGCDLTIGETARLVADIVGYRGRLLFDPSRPDGAPRKSLDARPLRALGWRPATGFREALEETYAWFLDHVVTEDAAHVRAAV